jgi:signal transduction histidine kinase
VVEAHQGYIDVQSTPEVGTTFTLSFPLAQVSGAAVPELQLAG